MSKLSEADRDRIEAELNFDTMDDDLEIPQRVKLEFTPHFKMFHFAQVGSEKILGKALADYLRKVADYIEAR